MKKRRTINILIIFIAVIAVGFGFFFYYKLNKLQSNQSDKKEKEKIETIQKEKSNLISKVSALYLFPEGEEPTIATVSDPSLLKEKSFFTTSEKGDKVLIFSKSGKAILYRPSLNKVIDIVSIQSSSSNNQNVLPSTESKN